MRELVFKLLIVVWVIFSVVYIAWDIWSDFKNKQLNQAYQLGKVETINQLITQAETCQPFPVFSGQKEVRLINTACLTKNSR